jgi:endonuclease/exonuclease/phosphatase family metal-dependent hydrolase
VTEENFNQSSQLLSFVLNKTSGSDQIYIMGDFNTSPDGVDIHSEFPNSYWNIRNANFSDSQWLYDNLTGTPLECTYCEDNPLADPREPDKMIDHIFISNSSKICVQNIEIFAKENM